MKATAGRAPTIRLIIAAVRAGASRDWTSHREALSLLRRFGATQTMASAIAARVLSWRSPLIHAPLAFMLEVAKWVRARLHPVRSKTKEITDL
jgi:hypothetical protein